MVVDRIDLNLLPIVVALHESRSVSQAALALGMSQPAVSSALGKLRTYFDDPLFVRTRRGMEPTPKAAALARAARNILSRIDDDILSDEPFDPATARRPFTLALSDAGEMIFLPRVLAHLRRLAPAAQVHSVSLPAPAIEQGLENGEIDLAIGYFPDLRKHNFFQQKLFKDTFASLLRAEHPIRARRLSLQQFLELEHAVVHAESRSQEVLERYLARKRIRRKVALLTPHFTTIPMIVAQSDLIVTMPNPVAVYYAGLMPALRIVELPWETPRIDIMQHWHRKYHYDGRLKWLRALVAELFQERG